MAKANELVAQTSLGEETGRIADVESQLAWQANVLSTVMENTGAMLVYLDRDFNFIMANRAYAEACGHTREELRGRNHFYFFPNEENEAIFRKVRDTGEPVSFHDKPFEYADQPWRGVTYWDWTLVPIKDGSNEVTGLVFSLVETTERKKADEELRRYREHLEDLVASRTGELRHLSHRLVDAQEKERTAIGHELHDEVGQLLTYAVLLIDRAMREPESRVLAEAKSTVQEAISRIRDLSSMLSLSLLRGPGLLPALHSLTDEFTQKTKIKVNFDFAGMNNQVPESVALACYRIIQEALTNVARHAKASEVKVGLKREIGRVHLEVADNGAGFNLSSVTKSTGLTGMRERALAAGGQLTIESNAGQGTRVTADIPCPDDL